MTEARADLSHSMLPQPGARPVEWQIAEAPVPYPEAVAAMEARVAAIAASMARKIIPDAELTKPFSAALAAANCSI